MPKLTGLLSDAGAAAVALKFIADTPTITMSRLKAILTGGLPTFLDIGQSFSAAALGEDNLLAQMRARGMRVVVIGDDTWAQLAPPDHYTACHPYPAFDVRDLHTVDDGVWHHLLPYLRHATACSGNCTAVTGGGAAAAATAAVETASAAAVDWDVLVAHYLGVDHAGHTYGGASKEMYDKLRQMDEQVATVAGDHGGGSDAERESVLLAFNMGRWKRARQVAAAAASGTGDGRGKGGTPAADITAAAAAAAAANSAAPEAISQIDLTPTLALLLGLPVPYGNLGRVNRRLWDMAHGEGRGRADGGGGGAAAAAAAADTCCRGVITPDATAATAAVSTAGHSPPSPAPSGQGGARRSYLAALRANAVQVGRYLASYAAKAGLPSGGLGHCTRLLREAHAAFRRLHRCGGSSSGGGRCCSCSGSGNSSSEGDVIVGNSGRGRDTAVGANAGDDSGDNIGSGGGGEDPVADEDTVASLYEAFLEAAASLARLKFTRFRLGSMALGCGLALGCVCLHVWLLARLCGCEMELLLDPLGGGAAAAAFVHALGLFSANWIQGEGRIQCYSLAAAALALWVLAAFRKDDDDDKGGEGGGPAVAAVAAASLSQCHRAVRQESGGCGCRDHRDSSRHPNHQGTLRPQPRPPRQQRRQQQLFVRPSWSYVELRRRARLGGLVAVALACNLGLQRYSLIDRWGSDPHDKRQLAAAGVAVAAAATTTIPQAAAGGAGAVVNPLAAVPPRALLLAALETLVPLGLLPALLAVLRPQKPMPVLAADALVRHQRRRRQQQFQGGWRGLQWKLLGVAPFQLAAALWVVQLTGAGDLSLRAMAAGPLVAALLAPARGLLRITISPLLTVLYGMGGSALFGTLRTVARWPAAALLWEGAVAVCELPLRLLLPRLVYGLACLGALQMPLLAAAWLGAAESRWRRPGQWRRGTVGCGCAVVPSAVAAAAVADGGIDVLYRGSYSRDGGDKTMACSRKGSTAGPSSTAVVLDAVCTAISGFTAVVSLLLGQRGPVIMLLLWAHALSLFGLLLVAGRPRRCRVRQDTGTAAPAAAAATPAGPAAAGLEAAAGALLAALGTHAFFLTGHFCEFSGLQYDSPFVGFDHMTWFATPLLFWLNSFGGLMLPALSLPLVAVAVAAAEAPSSAARRSPPHPGHARDHSLHSPRHHHQDYSQGHVNTCDGGNADADQSQYTASRPLIASGSAQALHQPDSSLPPRTRTLRPTPDTSPSRPLQPPQVQPQQSQQHRLLQQQQQQQQAPRDCGGEVQAGAKDSDPDCSILRRAACGNADPPHCPGPGGGGYHGLGGGGGGKAGHGEALAGRRDGGGGGVVVLVALSFWRSLALCTAVMNAALQRHHVVVWALFAPKLVFEVGFTAATYVTLLAAAAPLAAVMVEAEAAPDKDEGS
ncbi:hypothetical protein VOLCADRAFT_120027 [Volvox carteri f. nagariensis]|uniref:GPI ethanolamine phosphate transferase 3 n=1 Tax=Volvox carteri f. nagariensis TaxID=3068 RepID=D8UJ73_VOLCA|nr:uncharacterized protein VOLCADRAFT_120027 [Volvox carteri f. nagariensis]EFJ40222.1 hypothetical protein VOLCADRAFT_120027 [Volvox carteri f. nagariensis]|eukprot:XP_002958702.1 hypothetical protein VOLCADRAFT_120027 [Volvox carteri f. nagariensis]